MGADPFALTAALGSPLHMACEWGHLKVVQVRISTISGQSNARTDALGSPLPVKAFLPTVSLSTLQHALTTMGIDSVTC